jgi:hypothetical protein
MDRTRAKYADAIARQPGVDLKVSGSGWNDWDDSRTVKANLDAGDWKPDVILVYKPGDHIGVDKCGVPRVMEFNEAYDRKTFAEIELARPVLAIAHQEADVSRIARVGVKCIHLPHCADKETFYRDEDLPRPVDCLLTGSRNPEVYPLREKWANLINSGKLKGEIRRAPGHRLEPAQAERQFKEYAAHLRRAKILLVDSSIYQIALSKYVEGIAAGCVVVGDAPRDKAFTNSLCAYVATVDTPSGQEPDPVYEDLLCLQVQMVLDNPGFAQSIVRRGQAHYLSGFTTDHYAERFVEAVRSLL